MVLVSLKTRASLRNSMAISIIVPDTVTDVATVRQRRRFETAGRWADRPQVRRQLPLEHADIEIHEIESSRQCTATSFPVACECKKPTTPGWCIPRSTVVETIP